jgi:hypothetical protein
MKQWDPQLLNSIKTAKLKVAAIHGQSSTVGRRTADNKTSDARVWAVVSRSYVKEADSSSVRTTSFCPSPVRPGLSGPKSKCQCAVLRYKFEMVTQTKSAGEH